MFDGVDEPALKRWSRNPAGKPRERGWVQTPESMELGSIIAALRIASDAAKFPLHLTDSPAKGYDVRPCKLLLKGHKT